MKLTAAFLLVFLLHVSAKSFSQKITLDLKNVTPDKVFKEIKRQSGFLFLYNNSELKKLGTVSVSVKNADIEEVLNQCLSATRFTYRIVDRTIVLTPRPDVATPALVAAAPPGITVHGVVTDETGHPIEGVSVIIKGVQRGTTTNQKGEYLLTEVNGTASLVFSFVGLETKTVPVKDRSLLNISLKLDDKKLDETVIMGYGTTTKRKSTGSISSVTAEDIGKQPVQNPLAALEGRIAGAVLTQSNGLPGSRVSMLIRGLNSISNGTVPLYIIDGVPFNINDQAVPSNSDLNAYGTSGANGQLSPFSLINPSDIERIDVLKDADATAIYGTRGSNGVVLITTKKGKAGPTRLDLNVYQGTGTVGRFMEMMNLKQYLAMRREALANDGLTPGASNAPDLVTWDTTKATDWQRKYLGGTASTTDAQVTVSGGDARTRFLMGASYHRETTVYPGSLGDRRISARFNSEHSSLDHRFNANVSVMYSYEKSNLIATDLAGTFNLPPNLPLYNADGSLYWNSNFTNPESYFQQKYNDEKNNLISNAVLRYTIIPGLEIKTSLGFNRLSLTQNKQNPASSYNPSSGQVNNAVFTNIGQQGYILEPQLVYTKKISKGKLTALAGGTMQQTLNTTQYITATGYSNPGLLGTLAGASSYSISSITNTLYRYNSAFGRLTYDWNSKYIINGNIRRDGSSRFGSGNRFGTFGSVGAAWIFTNEPSIANAVPFLSFGKLRGSYGITGNDQLQDYQYLATLSTASGTSNYQGSSVLYPSRIANPDLHWETNKKMEIGLDLGFLKDRILLTVNAYQNRSNNQLGYLGLAAQSGFNSYAGNMPALLQNRGLEFELNTKNIVKGNFTWSSSFNLTIPQNKLLSIDPNYFYASSYKLGYSLNQVWKYNYAGVDPTTGNPRYRNLAKDTFTYAPNYSTDRSLIGNTDPKFYGGLSNTFSYKGIELSFFFQFMKRDGNIYPGSAPGILTNGNQNVYWLNRWTKAGDNTILPRATTSFSPYSYYSSSTATWGDNSFIKFKNISLSYTVPAKIAQRLKMSSLRFYMQGQNLFTWSKNKYSLDPETSTVINQSPVVMPPLRTITFGLNCSF